MIVIGLAILNRAVLQIQRAAVFNRAAIRARAASAVEDDILQRQSRAIREQACGEIASQRDLTAAINRRGLANDLDTLNENGRCSAAVKSYTAAAG